MKTISFDFDAKALVKPRPLKLETPQHGHFAIPKDPIYGPVRAFLQKYNTYYDKQYPFKMHKMLHTAAIHMLGGKLTKQEFDLTLFATGGLYLALDQKHESLAIDRSFGDMNTPVSTISLFPRFCSLLEQLCPQKKLSYAGKFLRKLWI